MGRTTGAKNIEAFDKRTTIATSASRDILHLAAIAGSPLERFEDTLKHEDNFLDWIVERHKKLKELAVENSSLKAGGQRPLGPKDATYKKYWWYAEQLVLLEAINSFEVFYKRTLIELSDLLEELIPTDQIKGQIDVRVLWSTKGVSTASSLLFESQLFHDLEKINDATRMLLGPGTARYTASDATKKERVRCLRAVFQLRHTLSHNAAVLTASDSAKFKAFGFDAAKNEVLDPTKEHFSTAVFRLMRDEAKAFTDWLRAATIRFLQETISQRDLQVTISKRVPLQKLLGGNASEWAVITWTV